MLNAIHDVECHKNYETIIITTKHVRVLMKILQVENFKIALHSDAEFSTIFVNKNSLTFKKKTCLLCHDKVSN